MLVNVRKNTCFRSTPYRPDPSDWSTVLSPTACSVFDRGRKMEAARQTQLLKTLEFNKKVGVVFQIILLKVIMMILMTIVVTVEMP